MFFPPVPLNICVFLKKWSRSRLYDNNTKENWTWNLIVIFLVGRCMSWWNSPLWTFQTDFRNEFNRYLTVPWISFYLLYTGWPVKHGRVFLIPCKKLLVQCTLLNMCTLDKSLILQGTRKTRTCLIGHPVYNYLNQIVAELRFMIITWCPQQHLNNYGGICQTIKY